MKEPLKPGRPPRFKSSMSQRISVRIPDHLMKKVEQHCEKMNIKRSELILNLLSSLELEKEETATKVLSIEAKQKKPNERNKHVQTSRALVKRSREMLEKTLHLVAQAEGQFSKPIPFPKSPKKENIEFPIQEIKHG